MSNKWDIIFEVDDKSGRKVRLTKNRWNHITVKHPYMSNYLVKVEETTRNPQEIVPRDIGNLSDFYNYYKHKKGKLKFLKIVVKYLNGDGFVISAYFVTHIN